MVADDAFSDESPEVDPVSEEAPSDDVETALARFEAAQQARAQTPPPEPALIEWVDLNGKGKPLNTMRNVEALLEAYQISIRYNMVSKEHEMAIPGYRWTIDNQHNANLAVLTDFAHRHGLSTNNLREFLCALADRHAYNPVADWITAQTWDGHDYFADLCDTLVLAGESPSLARAMIWRWMLSAVHAACSPGGLASQGVLVLQGAQGIHKTKWLKALVPPVEPPWFLEGVSVAPESKDSVFTACSRWIVELGELDATFKRADIAALKAFLTRDRDVVRRAYDRANSELPRRTVFCASVNEEWYLTDPTGNRRFWTVQILSANWEHTVPLPQLWAQLYAAYQRGELWYLTDVELLQLMEANQAHQVVDPVYERIKESFDPQIPALPEAYTTTQVAEIIGYDKPSPSILRDVGRALREFTGCTHPRKTHGHQKWDLCLPHVDRRQRHEKPSVY